MDKRKGLDPTPDSNPDPITNEPGAHPLGVAGGSSGGALTGAAIGGAVGGPVGAVIGGAIGAVAGGYAGKGAAEIVNPTEEAGYWQENYKNRPYYKAGNDYTHYEPAYRYGWEAAAQPHHVGKNFEDVEPDLEKNWSSYRGTAKSEWRDVRDAARDSFGRVRTRTSAGVTSASETARSTANVAGQKTDSVWDQVKGNWHQFKGGVKEKWNDLTDDDIEQMEGRQEKIVGKIQEKYGEAKWKSADIESELRNINRR